MNTDRPTPPQEAAPAPSATADAQLPQPDRSGAPCGAGAAQDRTCEHRLMSNLAAMLADGIDPGLRPVLRTDGSMLVDNTDLPADEAEDELIGWLFDRL